MGMLMHHTLMKQQAEAERKRKVADPADPVEEEKDEYAIPVKQTATRRKPSRK